MEEETEKEGPVLPAELWGMILKEVVPSQVVERKNWKAVLNVMLVCSAWREKALRFVTEIEIGGGEDRYLNCRQVLHVLSLVGPTIESITLYDTSEEDQTTVRNMLAQVQILSL